MVRVHTTGERRQGVRLGGWCCRGPFLDVPRAEWDCPAYGLTPGERALLQSSAVVPASRPRWRWHDALLVMLAFGLIAVVLSLPACGSAARTGISGAKSEVTRKDRTTVRINLPAAAPGVSP